MKTIVRIMSAILLLLISNFVLGSQDTERYKNSMKTIESGEGWRKVRFEDKTMLKPLKPGKQSSAKASLPNSSATLPPGYDELYIVEGKTGINNSTLPQIIKDELLVDLRSIPKNQSRVTQDGSVKSIPESEVFLVHAGMAQAIANGDISIYEQFAEQGKATIGAKQGTVAARGCWGWNNRSKSFSGTLSDILNNSLFDDANIAGNFDVRFFTSGSNQPVVKATINYAIKKWLCVPYKVRFRNIHARGEISADNASLKINAEVKRNQLIAKRWELSNIRLGRSVFFLGPVPVYAGANLPVDAGFDVNVKATGEVGIETHGQGAYTFDLMCNFKRCDGSTNNTFEFNDAFSPEVVAGVSANVNVIPYLEASVEGFLYDPWILSARVGLRPEVDGWVWGYWGNACGDSDNDGVNETVAAAVLDVSARLKLLGKYRLFGSRKSFLNQKIIDWHLAFVDFIPGGSSALEPVLHGPEYIGRNINAQYLVKMRPCVPYRDKVDYELVWDDGEHNTFSNSPQSYYSIDHAWSEPGLYNVKLTAKKDAKNRRFNTTTERTIRVFNSSNQNIAPYAIPHHSLCPEFDVGNIHCLNAQKVNDLRVTDNNGYLNIPDGESIYLRWAQPIKTTNIITVWDEEVMPSNYLIESLNLRSGNWETIKQVIGETVAFQHHNFNKITTKEFRIRVVNGATFHPNQSKLAEVFVYGQFVSSNLALQATASSHLPYLMSLNMYHPRFANDGNLNTSADPRLFWGSISIMQPNTVWYRLDWQDTKVVSQVKLTSPDGHANKAYKVQYLSGSRWVNLAVINNNAAQTRLHSFSPVNTRSIRVLFDDGTTHANGVNTATLSEIEVY